MIKQSPVAWDNISNFISSIGKENLITLVPLMYDYSEEGINSRTGSTSQALGNVIVTKYLIIYNC